MNPQTEIDPNASSRFQAAPTVAARPQTERERTQYAKRQPKGSVTCDIILCDENRRPLRIPNEGKLKRAMRAVNRELKGMKPKK